VCPSIYSISFNLSLKKKKMAPKKEQQQQAAAAAAAESTTSEKKEQQVSKQQQPQNISDESEVPESPSPILTKFTLIVLDDGRQLLGRLIAFDANCNVIVNDVLERKQVKEGLITQRFSLSLCVPFNRVKEFYQRDDDAPEFKAYEDAVVAKHKELAEKREAEQQARRTGITA
jgi:small nuclear ribonucleoprotein (snRNP)-like protein